MSVNPKTGKLSFTAGGGIQQNQNNSMIVGMNWRSSHINDDEKRLRVFVRGEAAYKAKGLQFKEAEVLGATFVWQQLEYAAIGVTVYRDYKAVRLGKPKTR